MKKIAILLIMAANVFVAAAQQGYYTRANNDKKLQKQAKSWLKSGQWRHDFTQADPHKSLNVTEFYEQYTRNPLQWRALFRWLADTDLLTIAAGQHPIPGTSLVASVEDSHNEPLEKRNSESHYHHIDFQYVVKGTERFGILDHLTSTAKDAYRPDVIHYNYDVNRTKFFDSTPKTFFLFFPNDWHIAKIECPKKEDQNIRVIVVKMDYIE